MTGQWRLGILVVLLISGVMLTGCGGSGAGATPTAGPPPSIGKIRVGISPDPSWEPWEFVDPQSGQVAGFDVDLMNTIAHEAGFEVEFVQVPFDQLLAGVGKGYEAAISALLATDERSTDVALSNDYLKTGLVQVVPSWNRAVWGMADVAGKKAGALAGSPGADEIVKVDPAALVEFQDNDTMFAALASSERTLDLIVTDYLVATSYMARTPGVLKSGPAFTEDRLAIAVDKSRSDVLAAINSGLTLAEDNYLVKDVTTEWLAVPPEARPEGFSLHEGR